MKNLDSLLKQCDDLVVAFLEFTEGLRMSESLKYFSDGFNSVAGLELGRERMSDEINLRLDFVLSQSRQEK
jgi:hypothetical protein